MAPEPSDVHENAISLSKEVDQPQVPADGTDDRNKASRHPRWTRQETFVLIQGKKVAENRVPRGRRSSSAFGSDQLEPKWDSVSSYCKQLGVNRGPVQCRKRWSNLLGDFKKIKTWESQMKEEAESFWMMRNDVRRERKLPGFFDKEVYEILDGRAITEAVFPLALVTWMENEKNRNGMEAAATIQEEEEVEAVFDSGQHAAAEDGLFSDSVQSEKEEIGRSPVKETTVTESLTKTITTPIGRSPVKETAVTESLTKTVTTPFPISEKQYQPFCQGYSDQGTTKEKQPGSDPLRGSMSQEGWKRRRLSLDGCGVSNQEEQLIKVIERNSNMLNAQLEAQNLNCQLDREQRKDHTDNLVAALSKLTDALVRIADKL